MNVSIPGLTLSQFHSVAPAAHRPGIRLTIVPLTEYCPPCPP
jgi:hypothetical protein